MTHDREGASSQLTISVLFRYRDLVASTLDEHRKLLRAPGATHCWWGWWKRPGESPRHEIWNRLRGEIARAGAPVRVGLFDSGKVEEPRRAVHAAWVDAVIAPVEDPDAAGWVPPELKEEAERNLIPEYYRNSPFSRAWLRLVRIEESPITDFFGGYSIDEPPPLQHYSQKSLDRLRNLRIREPSELTAMDTTIWSVHPYVESDHEERLLILPPGLGEPVSPQPIVLESGLILHLTDVHYAVGGTLRGQHAWRLESESGADSTLSDMVAIALRDRRVGALVVTGDLTFRADPAEFTAALKGLQRLQGNLSLSRDQVVIVPGNHDIRWTKTDSEEYDPMAEVSATSPEAEAGYRKFFADFYGYQANTYLSMGRRYVLPSGVVLEIAAVNSSSLAQGKNYLAGMGRVQAAALATTFDGLRWRGPGQSAALRVLALHHHLFSTDSLESPAEYRKGFGVAIDATGTQRRAARAGAQLVLHGHRHQPFVWRSGIYDSPESSELRWNLGTLSVVGGGSAGSTSVSADRRHFNLIEATSSALTLDIYRSENKEEFRVIKTWRADLSLADGSLAVGEWMTP